MWINVLLNELDSNSIYSKYYAMWCLRTQIILSSAGIKRKGNNKVNSPFFFHPLYSWDYFPHLFNFYNLSQNLTILHNFQSTLKYSTLWLPLKYGRVRYRKYFSRPKWMLTKLIHYAPVASPSSRMMFSRLV